MSIFKLPALNVWTIIDILRDLLALIGVGTVIKVVLDLVVTYYDLKRLESSYSQAIKFVRRELREMGFVLGKLPEEIIVEATYKGEKPVSSRLLALLKKGSRKLLGKRYVSIVIFKELSYPEQLALIIEKVFESALRVQVRANV